jgi:sensor histidine kinase regulating citrate/malate metabolism
MMVVLDILLAAALIALTVYLFVFHYESTTAAELLFLPVISVISLLSAVPSIVLLRPMSMHSIKIKQTEDSIENLNKLNNTLRAQRHDFMNHLQVVHSLVELEEYSEANDYINKVYADIEKVNSILKTGIPAVNAILESKRQTCVSKGIEVSVDVSSTLSKISIPDWELCRVLGNLIDNSINALIDIPGERRIRIEIFEDLHSYRFIISNNGPVIAPDLWTKIFEAGYTSGKHNGEGMGLAICNDIVSTYRGRIWVVSDEYETAFEGFIPIVH